MLLGFIKLLIGKSDDFLCVGIRFRTEFCNSKRDFHDEADIAVWLTYLSITVPAMYTSVPIRFWIMIGKASFDAYFKKSFLFNIHGFSLVLSIHNQLYHTPSENTLIWWKKSALPLFRNLYTLKISNNSYITIFL